MPVTVSITLTEEQEAYARARVASGASPDIETVVSEGLETDRRMWQGTHPPDTASLRELLDERCKGPFISMEEFARIADENAVKRRRDYGLPD